MTNDSNRTALGALVIAAAAVALYWPALSGTFIMDDDRYLTNNSIIASPDGLYRIWCTNELIDYWPLTYTSFWLEWRLWGLNPVGYHVTNLALHIATSLLLWVILRRLAIPGAWLAALVFAIHPVNVDSVAWISQRNELLAALFVMLSILCYVRAEESRGAETERQKLAGWGWFGLGLTTFALAILSKISVASLPLALLLVVWWLHGRITKWDVLRTVPFFGITLAAILIQLSFQKHGDPIPDPTLAERLVQAGAVPWFYLAKALAPINQAFIYPLWHIRIGEWRWWLPLATTLAVTLLLGWRALTSSTPWWRALFFAWAFGCVALAPVLGLIQNGYMVHSLVADRYQHLAIVAVIALLATGWSCWRQSAAPSAAPSANALAVIVLGALAVLTFQRSRLYGEPVNLFQASLQQNSESHLAEIDLAIALEKAGKLPEALAHARQAVLLNQESFIGHNVLGVLLESSGLHDEAIAEYEAALRISPTFPEAHNNLGVLLAGLGRPAEAIQHYRQALSSRPDFADARTNLGNALLATGHPEEAVQQYRRALEIHPDFAMAHYSLANSLFSAGRLDEAIEHYRRALRVTPSFADAHFNLGIALAKSGHPDEAVAQFQQTIQLKPRSAEAQFNLAAALRDAGRATEAIDHYRAAIQLNPDYAAAYNSLGNLLRDAGRPEEAIDPYKQAQRLNPGDAATYANLTKCYAALQRSAEAMATAKQALELARSQGDQALAEQIEGWMNAYRAQEAKSTDAQSPAPSAP